MADARHTDRWSGIGPTRCRGDLAFFTNDANVSKELVQWSNSKDNGCPFSIDDLSDNQFADVLGSLAESLHLDRVVDSAFVGTAEAHAEKEEDPMDKVLRCPQCWLSVSNE